MKMEKLDSKQMPQLIGLGVVSVVVFGWAAFSFLGGMAPAASQGAAKPADAAKASDGKAKVEVAQASTVGGAPGAPAAPGAPGTPGQPGDPGAVPSVPGMPGAGGEFNPDPFKSPYKKDMVAPKPAAEPKADKNPAPALPELGFQAPQWTPAPTEAPAPAPAAPAPPARPDVLVTGVIAGEGVRDMATLKVGTEERILQVGDRVTDATPYKVRKIAPDGVVLAPGKDSFFVALGAKTPVSAKVETK